MQEKPSVSIIIPTYNQASFLKICLDSVISQTYSNWEAIVVNNFSQDETIDVVTSITDNRIKLVNFNNQGIIGAARNEGVKHARAELIAFLDSDDYWEPQKLARTVATFNHNPLVDIICHDKWLLRDGSPRRLKQCGPYIHYRDLLFKHNCLSTSAVTLKHSAFIAANGFSEDPKLAGVEDYDLWLRLAKNRQHILFLHEPLSTYRIHQDSYSSQINKHMTNTLNLLDIHFQELINKKYYYSLLKNKRYADVFRSAGRSFMHSKDRNSARRLLFKALGKNPLDYKTWIFTLINEIYK